MRPKLFLVGVGLTVVLTGFSGADERVASPKPVMQREARYISLLIGAGNYKHAPEWKELKNLQGPRTDVVRIQHALRRWGFQEGRSTQRVLADAQASREGIADAFRWLASRATDTSDVVVIYYSGHGSWAPDQAIDAIRTKDEDDGFDEGLVPWDALDTHDPMQLVLDDEIGRWLSALGTRNVTMIVDACFSGTVTRGAADDSSASAPVPRGPRPPPYATLGGKGGMLGGEARMNHTLITAASSSQLAYERTLHPGAVVSGVFTRFLAEALDGADPNTRLDELMQQVRIKVGENQTPQLEGDRAARIFRVGAGLIVPARGYSMASPAGAGRVSLDVGALHGIRKGALYDVYPPGETNFRDGRLAQVRVDSILEASSFASVIPDGDRAPVPAGARATLSRVPPGALAVNRLALYVHPNARALRDSLAAVPWLELTDRPGRAMAELRQRGAAVQVLIGGYDIPPLRGDVAAGKSVPVGAGQVRGFTPFFESLCTPLRRAYSIAAMNAVRNEQPPPPERLKIDIRVLPAAMLSPTRTATSVDTVYVDELYNIWAWVEIPREAVRGSTLFLSVGVAGYSAAPRVAWPDGNRTQTRLTDEQLNRPLMIQPNVRLSSVTGVESIKAVVGSDAFDLRPLVNELPRCPVRPADGLRGEPKGDSLAVTGWTAIDRRVALIARPQP